MTGKPGFALLLWLAVVTPGAAGEHAACTDPAHDWQSLSATELRTIAAHCSAAPFMALNYHRAYLRDLLGEDAAVAGLITWTTFERQPVMAAHAVHMLLLEQLASLYYPGVAERVAFLNAEYEIGNEIAELWLHGYGTLATRLSEQRTDSTPIR